MYIHLAAVAAYGNLAILLKDHIMATLRTAIGSTMGMVVDVTTGVSTTISAAAKLAELLQISSNNAVVAKRKTTNADINTLVNQRKATIMVTNTAIESDNLKLREKNPELYDQVSTMVDSWFVE